MIESDGKITPDMEAAEQAGGVPVQDTSADNDVIAESKSSEDSAVESVREDYDGGSEKAGVGATANDTKGFIQADGMRASGNAAEKSLNTDNNENDGLGEIIGFGIKVAAFALSVVFLLISILALALPFQAMKVYNDLGLYDRALESGERYIYGRLKELDALGEDSKGNFTGITAHAELCDNEFVEALDVCITISNNLMRKHISAKSNADAVYYAERLEKFTRMYASLSGLTTINSRKDSANIANVPYLQLRPYVYNHFHNTMKLNYSARAVLGKTDLMMFNIGRIGDVMTNMSERLNTLSGTVQKASLIDQYVDFVDELNAYLDYEYEKLSLAGVEITEPSAREKYNKILDGSQFSQFIVPLDGFTRLYNVMSSTFTEYAQLAYDYEPSTMTDRLKQLYWLLSLSSFSEKMSAMSKLLYYNASAYGASRDAIIADYPHWDELRAIDNGVEPQVLIELYRILMDRYVSIIHS